jgi:hypothetical protein
MDGMAIMARARHGDSATAQLYIDLAGERFRDAAELSLTGATGLEPATPGFGDRCSTN